jgi:hypothetical protein
MKIKDIEPEKSASLADGSKSGSLLTHFKTFPLPPEDFNPLEATDATLKYHGIHPRPDQNKHPRLAELWDRFYSKKVDFVTPDFQVADNGTAGQHAIPPPYGFYFSPVPFWSGCVVETTPADPIWFLYANFKIPDLSTVPVTRWKGTNWIDTWLGIGGYKSEFYCQAGVRQSVDYISNGKAIERIQKNQLFMRWGGNMVFIVDSMGVAPKIDAGDEISILVCVHDSPATSGYFTYTNETKKTRTTTYQFFPPAGQNILNESAEFIVSRPDQVDRVAGMVFDNSSYPQPVEYGTIQFGDVFVYTQGGNELNIETGTLLQYDDFGRLASTASIGGPETINLVSPKF